jgi:hypothetical protein
MLKVYYLIVFFCLTISSTIAQSLYNDVGHIPESSRIDWTNAGLINKIDGADHFINISDYSGTDFEKITAALDDASEDGITMIYFPAGDYSFDNTINLKSNIVLMGEGEGITRFYFPIDQCSHCINITGNARTNELEIAVDIPKNGNEVTVLENLVENGYGGFPWIQYGENLNPNSEHDGYSFLGQVSKITNYDSPTSITVKDEASKAYSTGYDLKVWKMNPIENVGIENLSIERQLAFGQDGQGKGRTISINNAVNCWIRGVQLVRATGRHFTISHSAHIEISGCYANGAYHTHSDNSCGGGEDGFGYGIVLGESAVNCLIENNIFKGLRHSMLVGTGANTNVFTYNYSREARNVYPQELPYSDITLHGRYPYANLFEHNWVRFILADDTHGRNGPYNAFVRNMCEEDGSFRSIKLINAPHSAVIGNRVNFDYYDTEPIIIGGNTSISKDLYGKLLSGDDTYEDGSNYTHLQVSTIDHGYHLGAYWLLDFSYYYSERPYFDNNNCCAFPALGPNCGACGNPQYIPAKDRYDNSSEKTFNLTPTKPPIEISIDQKNSSNTSFGEIEYWLETWQPPIAVPNQFEHKANSDLVLRADKNINENEKFNNWNGSFYHNHYIFLIGEESVSYTAFHEQVVSVSLQAVNILGEPIAKNIDFKDPWLNDYSDSPYGLRNQGKSAPFKPYSTPYFITLDSPHFGVIKDQNYTDPTKPHYAVKAEDKKFIDQIDGEKWAIEFHHWSEPNGKATFQNADALETPVVFHADGAEIRANYDAYTRHLASETHLNADLSANRTVVYCEEKVPMFDPDDNPVSVGDYYYMIYQDGHRLYTTRSKDAVSWEPEELLLGNSDDPLYDFNPSIDFFNGRKGNAYANVSRLLVSYPLIVEDQNKYVIVIVVQEKDFLTDTWTEPMPVGGAIYLDNAGPVHVRTHASYAVTTQFRRRVIVEISDNNVNHIYSFISGNDNFSFQQSPGNILSGKNITYNNGHTNQDAFGITYFDNNGKLYYLYSDGETWHQSNQIKVSNPVYPHRMNLQNATLVLDEISGPNTISHIAWEVENLSFPSWHNKEVYYATVEGTTPANAIVTQKGKFSRIYNYENTLEPSLSIKAVGSDDVSVALGFARNPNKFVYLVQNLQESSRNWQHHSLGAGYRPVLGQQSDNMALWHIPNEDIYPFATTVLPDDGGIAMKSVVRLDYSLSPADNNNREGIISIDLVEVQKNDEKVDIKKNLKSEPLTFSGSNEKLSYAMSIRFINISDNIDPNKVLLSIAAESDEGKIPLSNFKVSELQDASDEQIKSVIKKSRIDNIPLDAGVVVIEPGVMTLMDKSIVFMTDDEIDDILSKASVIEEAYENLIPTQYALDQNYPNPFNPFTTITYALPEQGNVELTVYNSLGQKVKTLVNKHQQAGYHSYIFNGNSVASGIYFYSLKTAKYQQTRKMLLIK